MYAVPGYQAHWIPYLQDQGISPGVIATGLFTYGVFTVVARFWWGFLSGRYPLRWTATVQGIITSLTVILFLFVDSEPMLFVWAVATGLNLAGFFQLQALLSVNYFGRSHIGAIRGFMWPLATVTSAFSPMVLGVLRDFFGSYQWGWVSVALAWLLCAVSVAASKPPKQPARVEQSEGH
jgi:MFS family permease